MIKCILRNAEEGCARLAEQVERLNDIGWDGSITQTRVAKGKKEDTKYYKWKYKVDIWTKDRQSGKGAIRENMDELLEYLEGVT